MPKIPSISGRAERGDIIGAACLGCTASVEFKVGEKGANGNPLTEANIRTILTAWKKNPGCGNSDCPITNYSTIPTFYPTQDVEKGGRSGLGKKYSDKR